MAIADDYTNSGGYWGGGYWPQPQPCPTCGTCPTCGAKTRPPAQTSPYWPFTITTTTGNLTVSDNWQINSGGSVGC